MQEIFACPICGDSLRCKKYKNHTIPFIHKTADYKEKTCTGTNHCIQILVDDSSKMVDLLKISLNPEYNRFVFLDYVNNKCKVVCLKNNVIVSEIDVPKMIEPDFPNLIRLKEKVSVFIIFS
jgi:hypothetical protein